MFVTTRTVLALALLTVAAPAHAQRAPALAPPEPVNIVAIGASNTWGWGVIGRNAYPERLEDLLKAEGHNVRVINAGVSFDTTAGMLNRLDSAVPDGTHIVIVQPGANDLRFFGTKERRTANIEAMVQKLNARKIAVIVYDPVFPSEFYQWDRIHLTADAHAKIAAELLPQVIEIIKPKPTGKPKPPAKPPRR